MTGVRTASAATIGARSQTRDVTVCICTRNRPDSLAQTLDSVRASSIAAHQIVVADDSTEDRTAELIRRRYPEVTYLRGPRRGLGANRNVVASAATGEFVLFLDDDCLLDESFIARALAALDTVGDRTHVIVNGRENNRGRFVASSDQSFLGYQNRPYRPGDVLYSVVINAALFPRSLFDEVRFDERLIYGCDEIDVTTRAVAHGYRIVSCPEAVNHHFPSPVNRDYYGAHANSARLYVTFKRYWFTERRRLKAAVFLLLAVPHVFASMAKYDGLDGLRVATGVVVEALKSIAAMASAT